MKALFVAVIFLMSTLTGCKSPVEQSRPRQEDAAREVSKETPAANAFAPFYVFLSKGSRQNHYVPSGFMPNGNCLEFTDTWQEDCQSGKTCVKVIYDIECSRKDQKWAGIYWLNPANNWGTRKGGYNLTGATKLTFWAKGEKGGEQVQEFTIGGVSGDYPDSDTAVIGPVILGAQWRQYSIDLRGKDLSYISGGFAWTSSEDVNPGDCTFYLDNIRYE
ncbi:MAG: hypothetical protein KAS66_13145 [Candidatus Omnitrophica bacterium]|nr:hypothetical protein [Candidatus Omnitrophota bacterium]